MKVSHYKFESVLIVILLSLSFLGLYFNNYYLIVMFSILWLLQIIHSVVLFLNYWKTLAIRAHLIFYWLGVTALYLLGLRNKIKLYSDSFLEIVAKLSFPLFLVFYLWFITREISKNPPEAESS